MFKGSFVALVTPFRKGRVDKEKYKQLIEFHIKNNTDGIVPCGCTGEAATLSHDEQKALITFVVKTVRKRIPVVAGTGSNSTKEALALTSHAKRAGCDGVLLITPYYNKPTPEGQYRHYSTIANKVNIPIMLYNVPGRTGVSILPETVARLSKVKNIVAIKEASGSLDQVSRILSLCDITVMSGDDSLTLPMMAIGAKGVVSVVANIVPGKVHDLTNAFLSGNIERSREIHFEILDLCKAMFIETNPIPVKTALKNMRMLNGDLRLPLCEMRTENQKALRSVLRRYRLV